MKPTPFMRKMLAAIAANPYANVTELASIVYRDHPKLNACKNQGNGAAFGMNLNYVVASYRSRLEKAGLIRNMGYDRKRKSWEYRLLPEGTDVIVPPKDTP